MYQHYSVGNQQDLSEETTVLCISIVLLEISKMLLYNHTGSSLAMKSSQGPAVIMTFPLKHFIYLLVFLTCVFSHECCARKVILGDWRTSASEAGDPQRHGINLGL